MLTLVTVPLAGVKQGGPQVLSHLAASPVMLMSCPDAPTLSVHVSPPAATTPRATSTRITDRCTDTASATLTVRQPLHYRSPHRQQTVREFLLLSGVGRHGGRRQCRPGRP